MMVTQSVREVSLYANIIGQGYPLLLLHGSSLATFHPINSLSVVSG
jgi:hypothetical protein